LNLLAIKPLPLVNLGNDLSLCEGVTANLDATYLNSTYLWQDGSTNPVYTVTKQGNYFVQVNLNGCKRSDTVVANYTLKPKFTLGIDQFICPGISIILNPVVDTTWQLSWQDGTALSTFTVTQPGTYRLNASNTCGTTTDDVIISKGVCKVHVPNAFTPNNDGTNDLFRILGTETITEFNLKIFNRFGQVVFETADRTKGWDGRLKGQEQPVGAFAYMLQYKDINLQGMQSEKGTFVLLR